MRKRFSIKTLFVVIACFALCCSLTIAWRQSILGRNRYADRLGNHIEDPRARRPKDLTREQWDCMIDWTWNLHCNSLIAFESSTSEIAAFETRVDNRLSGKVDAATIEWIWDEYAVACPGGKNYQRFRLMVNESLTALNSPTLLEPPVMTEAVEVQ